MDRTGRHPGGRKKMKFSKDGDNQQRPSSSSFVFNKSEEKNGKTSSSVAEYSDPFAIYCKLDEVDHGKYAGVTRDVEGLIFRKIQFLNPLVKEHPQLSSALLNTEVNPGKDGKDQQRPSSSSFVFNKSEEENGKTSSSVADYSDPFAIHHKLDEVEHGKYESVTKDVERLVFQKRQYLTPLVKEHPHLSNALLNTEENPGKEPSKLAGEPAADPGHQSENNLDDDDAGNDAQAAAQPVILL